MSVEKIVKYRTSDGQEFRDLGTAEAHDRDLLMLKRIQSDSQIKANFSPLLYHQAKAMLNFIGSNGSNIINYLLRKESRKIDPVTSTGAVFVVTWVEHDGGISTSEYSRHETYDEAHREYLIKQEDEDVGSADLSIIIESTD